MSRVLIKPNGYRGHKVYHRTSDENPQEPRCGQSDYDRQAWKSVDESDVPHLRECKRCAGTTENSGPRGTPLATRLEHMDASEVGS